MNDAEFLFKTTSAERKRNGIGDFHKKRGGGRYVRLPSDNLSKKEKEMMNGEVLEYNMNVPVAWKAFKKWPQDLACEYIQRLEEAYNAKSEDIAGMLGVSKSSYHKYKSSLGIKSKSGHGRPLDRAGWAKFIGANEFSPEILVESSPAVTEKVELPEKKEKPAAINLNMTNVANIALLLQSLQGTGAKLTIEVTL